MPDDEPPQRVIVLEPRKVIVLEDADDNDCDNNGRHNGRYSSKRTERLGDIESRATDSLNRVAKAIKHGADEYTTQRNNSEKERKDGALVDFCVNSAEGVSKTIAESAPVLVDVAKAFTTNRRRKQIRRFVRSFPFRF